LLLNAKNKSSSANLIGEYFKAILKVQIETYSISNPLVANLKVKFKFANFISNINFQILGLRRQAEHLLTQHALLWNAFLVQHLLLIGAAFWVLRYFDNQTPSAL
jgi:hypothetical protein